MSDSHPCIRCHRIVDGEDWTCQDCLAWERAILASRPRVPSAFFEGMHASRDGTTMLVDFWYPRADEEPTYLQVGLYDVRAADDIRIHYDFDRDGYVIEQAWTDVVTVLPSPEHPHGYDEWVDRWEEVAFVKAWQKNIEKGTAGPGTDKEE